MSATIMYTGAGLAALGTAYFLAKDTASYFPDLAHMPILAKDDAAKMRLCTALQFDGLHPLETLELKSVDAKGH